MGEPLGVVAHTGVRLHEFWSADGTSYSAARESIATDGQGRFSLKHIDTLTPTVPKDPEYGILKNNREGFEFRYGGFKVRHGGAFARNWEVEDTGIGVVLNGRPCLTLRVWRTDLTGDSYLLRVDELNNVILKEERFNVDAILVERRSYQLLQFTPSLAGISWHTPLRPEVDMDPNLDLDQQTGFEVRAPRYLPDGFRPIEVKRIDDPNSGAWSKLVYSDGVRLLLLLQRPVEANHVVSNPQVGPQLGSPPAGQVQTHSGFARGADPVVGDQILFGGFGSISFGRGELQGREMYLIGHFDPETMLDVLESSLR